MINETRFFRNSKRAFFLADFHLTNSSRTFRSNNAFYERSVEKGISFFSGEKKYQRLIPAGNNKIEERFKKIILLLVESVATVLRAM